MGSHKKHERKKELRRKWKRQENEQTLLQRGAQAGFIPPVSVRFVEDEESPHPARC